MVCVWPCSRPCPSWTPPGGCCSSGFLGALTTFSSFSAEVVALLQQARYGLALGTASMHLFGSLLLTLAGIKTVSLFLAR